MLFCIIISMLLVMLSVVLILFERKKVKNSKGREWWSDGFGLMRLIAVSTAGIMTLLIIVFAASVRVGYNTFERKFEIQRQQYEAMVQSGKIDENDVTYVMDVLRWNYALAEYQADYLYCGDAMSLIPRRVMDIKPIGLE